MMAKPAPYSDSTDRFAALEARIVALEAERDEHRRVLQARGFIAAPLTPATADEVQRIEMYAADIIARSKRLAHTDVQLERRHPNLGPGLARIVSTVLGNEKPTGMLESLAVNRRQLRRSQLSPNAQTAIEAYLVACPGTYPRSLDLAEWK